MAADESSTARLAKIMKHSFSFKIKVIGGHQSGKSTLIARFALGYYTDTYISTLGTTPQKTINEITDERIKKQRVNIRFTIEDSGDKQFRTRYPEPPVAFIVTYDTQPDSSHRDKITSPRDPWEDFKQNFAEIDRHCWNNEAVVIAATKCDDIDEETFLSKHAQLVEFAASKNIPLIKVSAKNNTNLSTLFRELAVVAIRENKPEYYNEPQLMVDSPRPIIDFNRPRSSKRERFKTAVDSKFSELKNQFTLWKSSLKEKVQAVQESAELQQSNNNAPG